MLSRSTNSVLPTEESATAAAFNTAGWCHQRRDFLRVLGVSTGLTVLGPFAASAQDIARATDAPGQLRARLLADDAFWAQVHNMFALDRSRTFMNVGTAGSMPREVLKSFDAENRAYARESKSGYSNFLDQRKQIATGFGVDPDEIVLSYNTSAGLCVAILGIAWNERDVVVTTNHEHAGGNTPLQIAADRYGIQVARVALPVGNNQKASDYVALFDDRVRQLKRQGKRVRAMMWSAPTYKTGTMLPVADLMTVAREHGLISIVDGAHLPGMMAYNYADLGMDFMSGAGHKWQCGPGSTGILIVRNKIRTSNPTPLPTYWPILTSRYPPSQPPGAKWGVRATGPVETYDIASVIQSCGSMHVPLFKALAKSCEIWDRIGRAKIETYIVSLASYLKDKVAERWGVDRLYSPKDDPKLLSALTSFNPFVNAADITHRTKSEQFVARMLSDYAPGFVIRSVDVPVINSTSEHWPMRISTHLWHNAADVDRLVDAMWDLSRKMA
ncbi:aminotransferase class V-fold PLP-dependent enzyme [Paraburkholderia sp. BR14320]|uniref:aminotransferase class V-fold PLP-dependent enzyme n=1 Tax=unclassified Paraburkholderia TaxID=2615204 RepID=UPI0034CEB170